jgi:uncharacterized protein (DUF302 family)
MEVMKYILVAMFLSLSLFSSDIIVKESKYSVTQTIKNIKKIVKAKGMGVFAVVNHKGNAKMVGMTLRESKLIVFGNPKLGTKLIQENVLSALDLPLRILVYQDVDGRVKMAYRDASWLKKLHGLKDNKTVAKIDSGLDKLTDKAGK